jgi:hypothetical protein
VRSGDSRPGMNSRPRSSSVLCVSAVLSRLGGSVNDRSINELVQNFVSENGLLGIRNPALAANAFSDVVGSASGLETQRRLSLMQAVRERWFAQSIDGARWVSPSAWEARRVRTEDDDWADLQWAEALASGLGSPCGDGPFAEVAATVCAKLGLQAIRPMPATSLVEAVLARAPDGGLVRIAGMKVAGPSSSQLGVIRQTTTTVIESGRSSAWAYVASGAIAQTTLGDMLASSRPATMEAIQPVLARVIAAVEELHQAGMAHGSLSSESVIVGSDGSTQVLDIGLASLAGRAHANDDDLRAVSEIATLVITDRPARRTGAAKPLRDARPDVPAEFAALVDRCLTPQPGVPQPTARDLGRSLSFEWPTAAIASSLPPMSSPIATSDPVEHWGHSGSSDPAPDPTTAIALDPPTSTFPVVGGAAESRPMVGDDLWAPQTTQVAAASAPWPLGPPVALGEALPEKFRSQRLPMIAAGLLAVVALVVVAVVVQSRSSSGGSAKSSIATVAQGVATFDTLAINPSVDAERIWTANGVELAGETVLTNTSDAAVVVVYDEVIPDDVSSRLAEVQFDPPVAPDMLINETAGRHVLPLAAGESTTVSFEIDLDKRVTDSTLASWTDAWSDEYGQHLKDAEFSPVDGDVDGLPDVGDECAAQAGTPATAGCPDVDGDGVRDDDGSDACVDVAGTVATAGCPDADGDQVRDDGSDVCVDAAGTVATSGCPDADGDTVRDDDGSDACLAAAGPVATKGCPDTDGDTVADGDDLCPTVSGPVTSKGCNDSDGDGVDDGIDACASEPGSPGAAGCPDQDGDSVADGSDFCPANPGTVFGCPDSDEDGVVDKDDACPVTASTDKSGCPDSDGDGFNDGVDKCPNQGGPSGGNGCPAVTTTTRPADPGGGGSPNPPPPPPPSN